jgi:hypothetical protein
MRDRRREVAARPAPRSDSESPDAARDGNARPDSDRGAPLPRRFQLEGGGMRPCKCARGGGGPDLGTTWPLSALGMLRALRAPAGPRPGRGPNATRPPFARGPICQLVQPPCDRDAAATTSDYLAHGGVGPRPHKRASQRQRTRTFDKARRLADSRRVNVDMHLKLVRWTASNLPADCRQVNCASVRRDVLIQRTSNLNVGVTYGPVIGYYPVTPLAKSTCAVLEDAASDALLFEGDLLLACLAVLAPAQAHRAADKGSGTSALPVAAAVTMRECSCASVRRGPRQRPIGPSVTQVSREGAQGSRARQAPVRGREGSRSEEHDKADAEEGDQHAHRRAAVSGRPDPVIGLSLCSARRLRLGGARGGKGSARGWGGVGALR